MGLLSPRGSQITTTTVAGTSYAMIMTRERCLIVLEFSFCFFFDQGIGSRSAAWVSRVDVVLVSVCVSSVVGWWSYVRWCCIHVALYVLCMYPHLLCNVDVMISTLQKRLQDALLSLVGTSSSFRIGWHLGHDKLVSEPRPTLGAPLIDRSLAVVESRIKLFWSLVISESRNSFYSPAPSSLWSGILMSVFWITPIPLHFF